MDDVKPSATPLCSELQLYISEIQGSVYESVQQGVLSTAQVYTTEGVPEG